MLIPYFLYFYVGILFETIISLTAITVREPFVFLILQLRKLGAKNIEAGIGCGVGFGHGFGVGTFEEEMCCLSFMHDVDVPIS